MVMKDKLEKTNHKGMYYTVKKVSVGFACVLCLGMAVAIPTYIAQQSISRNAAHAEEEKVDDDTTNDKEEETDYESYDDQTL